MATQTLTRPTPFVSTNNGGNFAGSTFVQGEELKQVDAPIEGLMGAMSGGLGGAVVGGVVSAIISASSPEYRTGQIGPFDNMGKHLPWILGATTAFALVGALTRYSRASKHNEWAKDMTDRMFSQQAELNGEKEGFASRIKASREAAPEQDAGIAR